MGTVFWVGLILGAILGLVASILSNLWTDAIRIFLDKRRHIRLSNKKSKEVRTYLFVRALRDGNPSAKVLFDIDATFSNRSSIFTAICFIALFSIVIFASNTPVILEYPKLLATLIAFFAVFGLGSHLRSAVLQFKLMQVRRRLMWFHEYETGIRVKWGDDALEEIEMVRDQTLRN